MRSLILLIIISISFLAPHFASAQLAKRTKNPPTQKRIPADRGPQKVFTFNCRDDGGDVDNVIGLARVSYEQKNRQESGSASVDIFFRETGKGYRAQQTTGHFDKVANGWVLTLPHSDLNFFPDLRISQVAVFGKQACQITGEMESQ